MQGDWQGAKVWQVVGQGGERRLKKWRGLKFLAGSRAGAGELAGSRAGGPKRTKEDDTGRGMAGEKYPGRDLARIRPRFPLPGPQSGFSVQ